MYTVFQRANSIFAYALSVLAFLTFCCFVSTVFLNYSTSTDIKTVKVLVKNIPEFNLKETNDLGFLTFDLKTDLTSLFNWNVKQLFLYLTAEYTTPNNELNQVVLWDKIIVRGQNAVLDFKNMNTKYYFWDDGNGLKSPTTNFPEANLIISTSLSLYGVFHLTRGNKNITLTLSWNIIPNAGLLPNKFGTGFHSFKFPAEYTTSRM